MTKTILYALVLLMMTGCEKPASTSADEKVYSKQAITDEWEKMGDSSPLYQEANSDCEKQLDTGSKPQDIKSCVASSVAKQMQCQNERLAYFNKHRKWIPSKEYRTKGCA